MKFLLLLLNFVVEYSQTKKDARLQTRSIQSSVYEDMWKNKQFSEIMAREIINSQNGCAMSCNRNPKCRSFTFCGRVTCFLHKDDVFSTEEGENSLSSIWGCRYFGMKRKEQPTCKEGESFINIQEDNHKGYCQISSKRVDRGEWTNWEQTGNRVENSSNEFKNFDIFTRQSISLDAHGGRNGSDERTWYETLTYHVIFVKNIMSVWEAKANCENLHGELFEDLDGTQEQLDWLFEKMEGELFWLGIYTEDHEVWKTFEDEVISEDKLLWLPEQPNNHGGNQFYVCGGGRNGPVLEDYAGSDLYYSVCRIV